MFRRRVAPTNIDLFSKARPGAQAFPPPRTTSHACALESEPSMATSSKPVAPITGAISGMGKNFA